MYQFGREIDYSIEKLSPDNVKLLGDFTCGNKSIDGYLHKKCPEDMDSVCYLCVDNRIDRAIGFATISCSGIHFSVDNISQTLSAIQISYFAIDEKFHKLAFDEDDDHFYFSDKFFCDILVRCRDITENHIGARYIVLYSVPDAKHFYERNRFEDYTKFMVPDNNRYLDGCIPMFMEL